MAVLALAPPSKNVEYVMTQVFLALGVGILVALGVALSN